MNFLANLKKMKTLKNMIVVLKKQEQIFFLS